MRQRKKMKISEGRRKWIHKFSCPCCVTDETKVGLPICRNFRSVKCYRSAPSSDYGRIWNRL